MVRNIAPQSLPRTVTLSQQRSSAGLTSSVFPVPDTEHCKYEKVVTVSVVVVGGKEVVSRQKMVNGKHWTVVGVGGGGKWSSRGRVL